MALSVMEALEGQVIIQRLMATFMRLGSQHTCGWTMNILLRKKLIAMREIK